MGKKKKKPKYWVDVFESPDAAPNPRDFEKFRSLKKAVAFAIDHELPADRVVDQNGDPIRDLDFDAPQWWNHRRLETEYRNAQVAAEQARTRLSLEQDAYRNRQIAMIQAGYVPIELLTERLLDAVLEHKGVEHTTVTLTLSGNPGKEASMYRRRPFTVFLETLHKGLGK